MTKLLPQSTTPRSIEEQLILIDEVAYSYTRATRGVEDLEDTDPICVYDTHASGATQGAEPSRRCAVGRALNEAAIAQFGNAGASVEELKTKLIPEAGFSCFDDIFKPEYRGFPLSLWQDLQRLHDTASNWAEHGLSQAGVNSIRLLNRLATSNWYNTHPDVAD